MTSIQNNPSITFPLVNPTQVPSNPLEIEFLQAVQLFEADLKKAIANPNDPTILQALIKDGAAVQSLVTEVSQHGDRIDRAVVFQFWKAQGTNYDLKTFFVDCSKGDGGKSAMNELEKILHNPLILHETEHGLDKFNKIYPYPFPPSTN